MLFTPTVVKNLINKPATRKYPFEVRESFPMYRGELIIDINKCIFCGMCSRKCPSQCITVDKKAATWQCDPHACVYCGYCRDVCPTKCLDMKDVHRAPKAKKKKKVAPKKEASKAEGKAEKSAAGANVDEKLAQEKPVTESLPKKDMPEEKSSEKNLTKEKADSTENTVQK